jgi:hypothetical protein
LISIVIPTISGREDSLARCLASYEDTLVGTDREIIIIKDRPTWPTACNEGYEQAKGDIIHFTADDLEALPGWHVDAIPMLVERDELPAPRVMNFSPDGQFDNPEDGADGEITHFTRVPTLTRSQYERIGPWPEIIYYADLWVSEKARTLGIETRMLYSYAFVHHWSGIGRVDTRANLNKAGEELELLRTRM